jgi:hypothetical protein
MAHWGTIWELLGNSSIPKIGFVPSVSIRNPFVANQLSFPPESGSDWNPKTLPFHEFSDL